MSYEIEAKIKVEALEPVVSRLQELGAAFIHTIEQSDTHLADAGGRLRSSGCALRIRRQVIDGEPSARITFKGPREEGAFKRRAEYETGVADAETAETIFASLGYHQTIVVDKKRSLWRLDGCDVCLDSLPTLGCFVEVEGADEAAIAGVLEKLNLQNNAHIADSYAKMLKQQARSDAPI